MLFSNRSQEALQNALIQASDDSETEFSSEELEEISLALLSLCSSSLKMRMRRRSIGIPLPGTGENAPSAKAQKKAEQMNLFDPSLDGQGGSATSHDGC